MKTFLTVISFFFMVGCGDPFPTEHLINVDANKKICDDYLINTKDVTFKFDHAITFEECPAVYGFSGEDAGKVMSWIRRNKKKLDECASSEVR